MSYGDEELARWNRNRAEVWIRDLEAERDAALKRAEAAEQSATEQHEYSLRQVEMRQRADSALREALAEAEQAKKHIELAGGYHERTEREIELQQQLEAIPEGERDPADVAIGELLALVDAGRSRVHQAECEAEQANACASAMREGIQRVIDIEDPGKNYIAALCDSIASDAGKTLLDELERLRDENTIMREGMKLARQQDNRLAAAAEKIREALDHAKKVAWEGPAHRSEWEDSSQKIFDDAIAALEATWRP